MWRDHRPQIESAINGTIHHLRPEFLQLVAEFGMDAALELEVDATAKYVSSDAIHSMSKLMFYPMHLI